MARATARARAEAVQGERHARRQAGSEKQRAARARSVALYVDMPRAPGGGKMPPRELLARAHERNATRVVTARRLLARLPSARPSAFIFFFFFLRRRARRYVRACAAMR